VTDPPDEAGGPSDEAATQTNERHLTGDAPDVDRAQSPRNDDPRAERGKANGHDARAEQPSKSPAKRQKSEEAEKAEAKAKRKATRLPASGPLRFIELAFRQERLSPVEVLVLVAVARHANNRGRCFPSVVQIAAMTELGVRTVKRALQGLEDEGLIERRRRYEAGRRTSDEIILLIDVRCRSGT
jgi:DNA-binding MarR family transcriptional regulator